ncbi:MAG TPA: UvrD-helicase domain-containing protein, partial [Gammaproteobacteria bacterium]|nr:UvrD-helicase domain-containing protein [Gammaproteobacteria bacterium]
MRKIEHPPVDAAVRARALDPRQSFIVQAPAGSGKTELLTQRYLTLLSVVEEPEEILAITFTKKAAGEMRMRIARALELGDAQAPAESHKRQTWELAQRARARDRVRGWNIARHPARLRIQTIDSLNAELTRRMPLLSRFGAQPGIAERPKPLYQEAARRTLALLEDGELHATQAVTALLVHLDNSMPRVMQLIADMLPRRDQWLRHTGAGTGVSRREDLENALLEELRLALVQLLDAIPPDCREVLVELASQGGTSLHAQGTASDITACADLMALPGATPKDLPAWRGIAELLLTKEDNWRRQINANQGFPPESGADKVRMQELLRRFTERESLRAQLARVRALPEPHYPDTQWQVLDALLSLLPLAAAQLQLVFMEHGEVDYAEVALRALQALGTAEDPTDLNLALDHRLQHILVDEFQDTSVNQTDLLMRLTAGWQAGDGRTLFLVGDPMQSIYRFREAEVGLFLRARQTGIGQLPLTPLILGANFRSQAGLVQWFNSTFRQLFPSQEDIASGAVTYADAAAQYQTLEGEAVSMHALLQSDPTTEAAQVTTLIAAAHRERPDMRIAVLARARAHLAFIVRRLRTLDIPFRAVELEKLGDRPVVQDLLALTRALLHPADRTAWLAVLRAPWCGLSLSALHALVGRDTVVTIVERLRDEDLMTSLQAQVAGTRFASVRAILLEALAERRRGSLREQVEHVWLQLAAPATLRSSEDLADAEAYLELLEALDDGGELQDGAELEAALTALFARPDPRADESLQLMTIHKAKGLEFDMVIVPALGAGPGRREKPLLTWLERPRRDGVNDLLLAPLEPSGGERDPIYQFIRSLKREQERLEMTRLLYVAATRARERLHLFGHALVREKDGARSLVEPRAESLLKLLWPVVRGNYEAALHQQDMMAPMAEEQLTVPMSLRRLRPDWQLPEPDNCIIWPGSAETLAAEEQAAILEFEWVGDTLRHVGTVVHRLLQRIAADDPAHWDEPRVRTLMPLITHWLLELGVAETELDVAAADVLQALSATLTDTRGRWILDNRHAQARSEYALSHFDAQRLATGVIDRTFVDTDGIRWIVDYKTSRHRGGDVEVFLAREQTRYRKQLESYAQLMRGLEQRRVKVGLYFPLLRRFVEWE